MGRVMDDKKLLSLLGTLKTGLEGLRAAAALSASPARTPEGRTALSVYGPIRTEAARLAAGVRQASPGDFAGSRASAESLRGRQARIEVLTDARALFEEAVQLVGAALAAEKEAQALEIDETVKVVTHVLGNPLCSRETRERLSPFGTELLAQVQDKNAALAARRLGTTALKQENAQVSAENEVLKRKTRLLEGEPQPPAELAVPAPAPAPASRRRRPR